MSLKQDYKDYIPSGETRVFNIVDAQGNVLFENVAMEDVTNYEQIGDDWGANDINITNEAINSPKMVITVQPTDWVDGIFTLFDSRIKYVSETEQDTVLFTHLGKTNYTVEEWNAMASANITPHSQTNGSASIICEGVVPTIPLKILVKFMGVK